MHSNTYIRIGIFLSIVLIVHFYGFLRLTPLATTRTRRSVLAFLIACGPLGIALGRGLSPDVSSHVRYLLSFIGYFIGLSILVVVLISLLLDIKKSISYLWKRFRQPNEKSSDLINKSDESNTDESKITRREFVTQTTSSLILSVGVGSSSYAMFYASHDYTIEEIPFVLRGLSSRYDGYTIVQLSDLHAGIFVGEKEFRTAVSLIIQAKPDLIVLTGDLVDHDPYYISLIGRFIRNLEGHARDGVVVIAGNHDYYTGVDEVLKTAQAAGARVLRNHGLTIGSATHGIALLGVDDLWGVHDGGPGPILKHALAQVPQELPRVLLCHNPAFFPEAAASVDLQLSGHTHGGQIGFGSIPANIILPYGYVRGIYHRNEATLYVNRGFGTAGPPGRIGSSPEVSRIILSSR